MLWSRHNPGLTAERAAIGAKELANYKMVVLENSAHWPQWEEADAFNKIHCDFMK